MARKNTDYNQKIYLSTKKDASIINLKDFENSFNEVPIFHD